MGLILSARRAGSTQASSPAPSITADVTAIQAANDTTSSAGRPVGPPPSATKSSTRPPPAVTPLPISTMAWATILASTWRGLAPSAIRSPISRVRRDTLIDISEKSPMADRNNTSALTPASAATGVTTKNPAARSIRRVAGLPDGQSGIDISRNRRQTSRQCGWIAAQTHTHDERRHRGGRRGVKHIRGLVALLARVQAEIPHHADDFERLVRRSFSGGGRLRG